MYLYALSYTQTGPNPPVISKAPRLNRKPFSSPEDPDSSVGVPEKWDVGGGAVFKVGFYRVLA